MKRRHTLLILGVVLAFVLAACGEEGAHRRGGGVDTAGRGNLGDLGCTVTIGVENAYLPFNYIPVLARRARGLGLRRVERTSAACINCEPEFVESAWPSR